MVIFLFYKYSLITGNIYNWSVMIIFPSLKYSLIIIIYKCQ